MAHSQTAPEATFLSSLDRAALTPVVRKALSLPSFEVTSWRYERVHGGAGDVGDVLSGVFRFTGIGHDQGRPTEWSLILKVVGTTGTDDDPSASRYWRREVLAYESGHLSDLPGGLTAPRYFGAIEFSEKMVGLWLEELTDRSGPSWPLEQYRESARHLGQFNGAFLTTHQLPDWPWLLHNRLDYLAHGQQAGRKFEELRRTVDWPKTRRWFVDVADMQRMLQLWEERMPFLDALARLPQTLVHGDAFRRNLFAARTPAGHDQTVAIDWTFVGTGAIGLELASLVQGTLFFSEFDVGQAHALDQAVFDGYVAGLQDAGWQGDPRLARLGYAAGSAMIFGLGYGAFKLNEAVYPWLEQAFGLPMDQFMDLGAALNQFFLELADEARAIIHTVKYA